MPAGNVYITKMKLTPSPACTIMGRNRPTPVCRTFGPWGRTLTILSLAILFVMGAVNTARADQTGPIKGRFIVKLRPHAKAPTAFASLSDNAEAARASSLQVRGDLARSELVTNVYVVVVNDTLATAEDVRTMIGSVFVEYVEQDYWLEFFDYPTDPLFDQQWYLRNTGQPYVAVERINGDFNDTLTNRQGLPGIDLGLDALYTSPPAEATDVVVAIVDSGVDTDHPELQGRFWRNEDEIPGNGLDDDHNGLVDDTLGYDVSGDSLSILEPEGDNDPTDIVGHGTHVAGLVASSENAAGIVGAAPYARIMAVKIRPNATNTVGAMGIIYAVNSGADIVNVSWGSPYDSQLLKDAIEFARANDVLVCIAAGNSGDNTRFYPAAFDSAFTVAACDAYGHIAYFSTWGGHINVVAPGLDILSLRASGTDLYAGINEPGIHMIGPDSLYYLASGTSMSTPLVCAAAARLLAVRPDLTVRQLESLLETGATDIVDPFNTGESYPGPDSISGYGMVDVSQSLILMPAGGLFFTSPTAGGRYINEIQIRATTAGSYSGGWQLDYAMGYPATNWLPISSGSNMPADSLLATFSPPGGGGELTLRLTDDNGIEQLRKVTVVSGQLLELTSPVDGTEYTYNVPISGSAYGIDFDSLAVYYRPGSGNRVRLTGSYAEFFDTLLYSWNASGINLGGYTVYLHGYFSGSEVVDSVSFTIASAFAAGWPRTLTGRGSLGAVSADLEGDGQKEIIVGTAFGLNVFHSDGQPLPGYPVLPGLEVRGMPAVYDVDSDGEQEIIFTSDSGLHVINPDGSDVPGWPVDCFTGRTGFGYPVPTVTRLNVFEDSAIVMVNRSGDVLAYDFDGSSYFYSLEGWFASFFERPSGTYFFGGDAVAVADLDGNGSREVVVAFSGLNPHGGVGVFDARTGLPAFERVTPQVLIANSILGTVLADLTGDGLPEIVTVGTDTNSVPTVWVKKYGLHDLPGYPVQMPSATGWRGNFGTVADLDQDGHPEVLCSFFGFDLGSLFIFKVDGSPYLELEGRPYGEAYYGDKTFGPPIVADVTGDPRPEVIFRGGYIFPGTGRETVHILDYTMTPIPGWPVHTPAPAGQVFSTPYTPMVDDFDGDSLVELVFVSEDGSVYAWDFDAPVSENNATGRLYADNFNSSYIPTAAIPLDVEDEPGDVLPQRFALSQNYPNPFNPSTEIAFALPRRADVTLEVFNVLGQRVMTLVDSELPAGEHVVTFDAGKYASGVYLYRLVTDNFTSTRKMVLVK